MPPYSPRPAALVKAKIDLGWVFLINSVSSFSEPRQKYPSVDKASHSYNICDIRFKFFPTIAYEIIALQADAFLASFDQTQPTKLYVIHSNIHRVLCLTTVPEPLPKRALQTVWSTASSFKREYPILSLRSSSSFLRLLPRLPVTSIYPFIFPSITRCRRQFLRKIWPTQLAFRLRISCRIFLCYLTPSNTSFLTRSVQLISTFLQHHISKFSRCFWSTAQSVQVPVPYKDILQM